MAIKEEEQTNIQQEIDSTVLKQRLLKLLILKALYLLL